MSKDPNNRICCEKCYIKNGGTIGQRIEYCSNPNCQCHSQKEHTFIKKPPKEDINRGVGILCASSPIVEKSEEKESCSCACHNSNCQAIPAQCFNPEKICANCGKFNLKEKEDWEEELEKDFEDMFNSVESYFGVSERERMIVFIKKIAQSEYERGKRNGYAEEGIECEEHCEKAKQEGRAEGIKELAEKMYQETLKHIKKGKIEINDLTDIIQSLLSPKNETEK